MDEHNRDLSSDDEKTEDEQNKDQNGGPVGKNDGGNENGEETEEKVLQFLDSLDNYLILMDSLSTTLRQGWFDLASARYSMGASRVTSALFDLKLHPAATTFEVTQLDGESSLQDSMVKQPRFSLSRWSSSSEANCCSREIESDEVELQNKSNSSLLRHRGTSEYSVDNERTSKASPVSPRSPLSVDDQVQKERTSKASPVSPRSPLNVDDQVQKERSKSLSVFGTLVSPKLREAQGSFETALETLVEISNMRSLMLSAHVQIQQKKDNTIA